MYKPKLKYIFCLMRKRSLMPAMSVMRYMNSVGIIPQILIGEPEPTKKELDLYKVKYQEINKLPEYDVMLSEANGHLPFEIRWMTESKKRGKTNVMLINSLSSVNIHIPSFTPDKTKLLDGMCMKADVDILQYRSFNNELFMINVGDPDWDYWKTEEFKKKEKEVRDRFGNKIFVICCVFARPEEVPYTELCIKKAKELGFSPIINVHPDRWSKVPASLLKYCNKGIHHHVLFSASSHLLTTICSTVFFEGLYLRTHVGCNQAVYHSGRRGNHVWLNKETWFKAVSKQSKQEFIDMAEPVFNEADLESFLLSPKPKIPIEQIVKTFGLITVPCYTEYLFKTLDKKLKG